MCRFVIGFMLLFAASVVIGVVTISISMRLGDWIMHYH